jgi:hypothetical protein
MSKTGGHRPPAAAGDLRMCVATRWLRRRNCIFPSCARSAGGPMQEVAAASRSFRRGGALCATLLCGRLCPPPRPACAEEPSPARGSDAPPVHPGTDA